MIHESQLSRRTTGAIWGVINERVRIINKYIGSILAVVEKLSGEPQQRLTQPLGEIFRYRVEAVTIGSGQFWMGATVGTFDSYSQFLTPGGQCRPRKPTRGKKTKAKADIRFHLMSLEYIE